MIEIGESKIVCDDRTVHLFGMIDSGSAAEVSAYLLKLIKSDDLKAEKEIRFERKPICIYINSEGGYVDDAWSLINIIKTSKTPIETYCSGKAASAALLVFLAGHKRFTYEHSHFMYHQCGAGIYGRYLDISQHVDRVKRVEEELELFVLEHSKITRKRLDEITEKKIDWWITPKEAIKLGVADEIIQS